MPDTWRFGPVSEADFDRVFAVNMKAIYLAMKEAVPRFKANAQGPKVLIEWWPKPVISPTRQAWATDLIELAGGVNPWAHIDAKSTPLSDEQIMASPPDVVAMSWCGVKVANYRADVVSRRPGWAPRRPGATGCRPGGTRRR